MVQNRACVKLDTRVCFATNRVLRNVIMIMGGVIPLPMERLPGVRAIVDGLGISVSTILVCTILSNVVRYSSVHILLRIRNWSARYLLYCTPSLRIDIDRSTI